MNVGLYLCLSILILGVYWATSKHLVRMEERMNAKIIEARRDILRIEKGQIEQIDAQLCFNKSQVKINEGLSFFMVRNKKNS